MYQFAIGMGLAFCAIVISHVSRIGDVELSEVDRAQLSEIINRLDSTVDRVDELTQGLEVSAETGDIDINVERPRTHADNVRDVLEARGELDDSSGCGG